MKQKRNYRSGVMFYGKTNSSYSDQSKQNGTFGFQKGDTGAKIKAIRENSPPLQKNKKPERHAPNLEAD